MITADSPVFAPGATINVLPDDLPRQPLPPPLWPLTQGNHFRFGFDAAVFAARRSGGARYWTAYGAPARPHDGFVRELARAMAAIAEAAGPIAIAGTGGPAGVAAAALARRLGLDAVVVGVEFVDHPGPTPAAILPVQTIRTAFEPFAAFALDFARRIGCGDAWVALVAFQAEHCDRPLVSDHGEMRLVDNGVDQALRLAVAPPLVTLVDNETFTGLDRWLLASRRRGVPQLLRWSPELVAAQLDSGPMRGWLAATHAGERTAAVPWTNRAARLALWRQSFPELSLVADARAAWRGSPLVPRMRELSRRMRRAAPGCAGQHHTPLHRLAERLGVALDPVIARAAALYGTVAPAAPRRIGGAT